MWIGPVLEFELKLVSRRTRYYLIRFLYGLALFFFIWVSNPRLWGSRFSRFDEGLDLWELANLGETIFSVILVIQFGAIFLVAPALVAGVIAEERQRKTLLYLLASQLTSREIVLGKLTSRVLVLALLVAATLPITSLVSLFGGVDPWLITMMFLLSLTTCWLLSAVAILVSVHARRPRGAILFTYVLELIWLFAPSIAQAFHDVNATRKVPKILEFVERTVQFVAWTCPFDLMFQPTWQVGNRSGLAISNFLWMSGLQLAVGSGLVLLAALRLRPVCRRLEGRGATFSSRWYGFRRRFLPRPACGDDPMIWKECFCTRHGPLVRFGGMLTLLVIAIVSILNCWPHAKNSYLEVVSFGYGEAGVTSARVDLQIFVRTVCGFLYVLMALAVACVAATVWSSELESDTWLSLVSTPLDSLTIVRAKLLGSLYSQRYLFCFWLAYLVLGAALGAIHPVGFGIVLFATVLYLWFAAAMGGFLSLLLKNSTRSLVATVGLLGFVNVGYLFCLLPILFNISGGDGLIWMLMGCTPFVESLTICSYQEFNDLFSEIHHSENQALFFLVFFSLLFYFMLAWLFTIGQVMLIEQVAGRPTRPALDVLDSNRSRETIESVEDSG